MLKVSNITKDFMSALPLSRIATLNFKRDRAVRALDDVSFSLPGGSILGILGPNGAGKTTLLKIISTLILPDRGTVELNGLRLGKDDDMIKACIGFAASAEKTFYQRMTGRQNLEFFAALYGLTSKQTRKRLNDLFCLFDIDYENKRFDSYSAGMQQKFGLARAMLHNPEFLLLDEPTKSLDYASALHLRDFIKNVLVKKNGKTVLFTTHRMDEAMDFADLFLILRKGKTLGSGTLEDLKEKAGVGTTTLSDAFIRLTSGGREC